jgi:hypothetical protein
MKPHILCSSFPPMSDDDFNSLVQDIRENGQLEPIIMLEGCVLDGWHRFQACAELNKEPKTKEFSGDNPASFVLSKNLHRRHMEPSQRAVAVASCREWKPKGNQNPMGNVTHSTSVPEMAKEANVSEKTIKDAKVAIKSGQADAVLSGKISVSKAADIARGKPQQKVPQTPKNRPECKDDGAGDDGSPDLAAEYMALSDENEKLQRLNESLLQDDAKKEIVVWKEKFESICGRLDQVNATCAEMKKQLEYQTKLLASIRSELGVQKNSEIINAIQSR